MQSENDFFPNSYLTMYYLLLAKGGVKCNVIVTQCFIHLKSWYSVTVPVCFFSLLSILGGLATAAEECKNDINCYCHLRGWPLHPWLSASLLLRHQSSAPYTHIHTVSTYRHTHAQHSLCHLWPLRNIHADLTVLRKHSGNTRGKILQSAAA